MVWVEIHVQSLGVTGFSVKGLFFRIGFDKCHSPSYAPGHEGIATFRCRFGVVSF
jgi:hypothetical protein